MKMQDSIPFDSAILGLDDKYIVFDNGFYVHHPSIFIPDQKIVTGDTYLYVTTDADGNIKLQVVEAIDVFYNVQVKFIMRDVATHNKFELHLDFNEHKCPWRLIDVCHLRREIDRLMVKIYCGCTPLPKGILDMDTP